MRSTDRQKGNKLNNIMLYQIHEFFKKHLGQKEVFQNRDPLQHNATQAPDAEWVCFLSYSHTIENSS